MSDVKLEEDVRRALRATADKLVVDDRPFVPGPSTIVELPDALRTRRPRGMLVLAAAVLSVFVAAGVVISQTTGSNRAAPVADAPTVPTTAAPTTTDTTVTTVPESSAELAATVAAVPVSVLDQIGRGTASGLPTYVPGPVLTDNGKPRIVWIGAEYCPYCATERWPLVLALSRFGTFSDLGLTRSSATDVFPSTPSFSFHGSTYSSQYLAFEGVETTTSTPTDAAPTCPPPGACPLAGAGYTPLDAPTADQLSLFEKYDAPPYVASSDTAAIPFIDFANSYVAVGATYSPTVLREQTATDIASALSDPTGDIAKGVDGAANVITAVLCKLTNGQPVIVCSDPAITAIESQLA